MPNHYVTYAWGRRWVGCDHGRETVGGDPVRICQQCFLEILAFTESAAKAIAETEDE